MMRILITGDTRGIPQLLRHLPVENVCGMVAATIRPQYHEELRRLAESLGVPFLVQPSPTSACYPAFRQAVESIRPDLIWVNSYSMIMRADILAVPGLGGVNIHGGLLPRYRGCNPTQWAILNGETQVGATLHEMTAGLDEGDIIDQRVVPLHFEDTWVEAQDRIGAATEVLIADNLPGILEGNWKAARQDVERAQYCRRRTPEDGLFQWSQSILAIYNLVRAVVAPHPGAFYMDENDEKVVLDRYQTPSEIAALKFGPAGAARLQGEAVRLRPIPAKDTGRLSFTVEDAAGRTLGACQLQDIDWPGKSARLGLEIEGREPASVGAQADALGLMIHFGFEELGLAEISMDDGTAGGRTWAR